MSQPIARGLDVWVSSLACSMRATSKPTERLGYHPACSMRAISEPSERSGARRSGFPSGVFHKGRERADRSLGGSTPGNNSGLSADLWKYLLQPGELQS